MPDPTSINREQALDARPVAIEPVKVEPLPDGGARWTTTYRPTGIHRWLLRMPETATRRFELDALGVEVLGLCDGRRSVRRIVEDFAQAHRLNRAEAERAVVTFLRTMLSKGLLAVAVEQEGKSEAGGRRQEARGKRKKKRR